MDVLTLQRETEAAKALLSSLSDILGDDAELIATTIEGETGLQEQLHKAVMRLVELDALIDAIGAMKKTLQARCDRLDAQRETLRTAVCAAMEISGQRRLETPCATVSMKAVPPKLVIDESMEADIPSDYWEPQPPKLNKKLIMAHLKDKKDVPGAKLSNGGVTIQIRGL